MNIKHFRRLARVGYFRLARNVAKYSKCRIQVGAVLSRKSPISVGFNVQRTHPEYCNPSHTDRTSIHAEIMALSNAGASLDKRGCEIFVYRCSRNGIPAIARPCDACIEYLKREGIKKIWYTTGTYPYYACERL